MEPARLGRAIAIGPHTQNFTFHVGLLRAAGVLEVVEGVPALTRFVDRMLTDADQRRDIGERAKAAVRAPETLADDTARALLALTANALA